MKIIPFQTRNMLQKYEQQLLAARRLERYRQAINLIYEEPLNLPEIINRKILVRLVAKEFFKNFLITGYSSSVVQDVQKELIEKFNNKICFQYPPESSEVVILVKVNNEWEEVGPKLKTEILFFAWTMILDKVNTTML